MNITQSKSTCTFSPLCHLGKYAAKVWPLILYMTLFKLVASSSEEKVADFSEKCSRRVSLVVGGY